MAFYGEKKYGSFRYGISRSVGNGSVFLYDNIHSLKVYLRKVGQGFINSIGSINKFVNRKAGNGIVAIVALQQKRIDKKPLKSIIALTGYLLKKPIKIIKGDIVIPYKRIKKSISKNISQSLSYIKGKLSKKVNKNTAKSSIIIIGNALKQIPQIVGRHNANISTTFTKCLQAIRNVGSHYIISSGNAIKSINLQLVSAVRGFGDVRKSVSIHFSGIVISIDNTIKTATKRLYSFINIKGVVSKMTSKFAGKGNVSMEGVLFKMQSYFIVKGNGELYPLDVLVLRDTREELIAGTRDNVDEIPGLHGEYDFGTELRGRSLELKCATKNGLSFGEKMKLRRKIAEKLNPMKGYRILIFEDDPDIEYKVKYSGKIDITNYPKFFEFAIPFKMEEPFTSAREESVLVGSGEINNQGSIETGLIIEIKGSANNPSLTIGNETLKYTGTIPANKTLIINTLFRTVKIDNENVLDNYNGVFPLVETGETNVVAGNNVTIKWVNRYL